MIKASGAVNTDKWYKLTDRRLSQVAIGLSVFVLLGMVVFDDLWRNEKYKIDQEVLRQYGIIDKKLRDEMVGNALLIMNHRHKYSDGKAVMP